jgi:hypothetical protein
LRSGQTSGYYTTRHLIHTAVSPRISMCTYSILVEVRCSLPYHRLECWSFPVNTTCTCPTTVTEAGANKAWSTVNDRARHILPHRGHIVAPVSSPTCPSSPNSPRSLYQYHAPHQREILRRSPQRPQFLPSLEELTFKASKLWRLPTVIVYVAGALVAVVRVSLR